MSQACCMLSSTVVQQGLLWTCWYGLLAICQMQEASRQLCFIQLVRRPEHSRKQLMAPVDGYHTWTLMIMGLQTSGTPHAAKQAHSSRRRMRVIVVSSFHSSDFEVSTSLVGGSICGTMSVRAKVPPKR